MVCSTNPFNTPNLVAWEFQEPNAVGVAVGRPKQMLFVLRPDELT